MKVNVSIEFNESEFPDMTERFIGEPADSKQKRRIEEIVWSNYIIQYAECGRLRDLLRVKVDYESM